MTAEKLPFRGKPILVYYTTLTLPFSPSPHSNSSLSHFAKSAAAA